METENTKPRRNIFLIVVISLAAFFTIYFTVMSVLSPARKLDEIKNEYGAKSSEKEKAVQTVLTDAAYLKLLKQKSFLQSRILMAGTDFISSAISCSERAC
jgi:hypothetical protein